MSTATHTKPKPLPLTGAQVRALLAGETVRVERVIKPQPDAGCRLVWTSEEKTACTQVDRNGFIGGAMWYFPLPERVWCRETWHLSPWAEKGDFDWLQYRAGGWRFFDPHTGEDVTERWPATDDEIDHARTAEPDLATVETEGGWKSPATMPKRFSRLNAIRTSATAHQRDDGQWVWVGEYRREQ